MKKFSMFLLLLGFLFSPLIANVLSSKFNISDYEIVDLEFLRTHYPEINNGRSIQIDANFLSLKWKSPFEYRERLKEIGLDVNKYNIVEFNLKEKDDVHYSFPNLLFHTDAGDLNELNNLVKGERVVVYGKFYKVKKSEFIIDVDLIEVIQKGGHSRSFLLDARVSPTPTYVPTLTPTPGLNIWQKLGNFVNPKETPTVTGTVTPTAQ